MNQLSLPFPFPLMRITVRRKNIDALTPSLEEYIEKKIIQPVKKLLASYADGDLPVLDIEVGRTTKRHRKGMVYHAQATLAIGKKILRAEVENEDVRAACDLLKEELEREIEKHKDRNLSLLKRGARRLKKLLNFHPDAQLNEKGRVREEGN